MFEFARPTVFLPQRRPNKETQDQDSSRKSLYHAVGIVVDAVDGSVWRRSHRDDEAGEDRRGGNRIRR